MISPAPQPPTQAFTNYNPGYNTLVPQNVPLAWVWNGSQTGNQGQGVKVGILDSGVQANNPAFTNNQIAWFQDYVDPTNTTPQDTEGHGTTIAELIAGTPNQDGSGGNYFNGGVAPQASLYVARVGANSDIDMNLIPQALSDLTAQGVKLINNSYGSAVPITSVGPTSSQVTQDYSIYGSTAKNGQLMVWAAGNNGNAQPSVEAGLPYWEPSLQNNWIAVVSVALNASGQVTGLDEDNGAPSNACGAALAWCLAAPGLNYFSPVANTSFSTGGSDGTSDAAAIVTGVAALVWQRFPFFTATNVQETLLGTTTSLGSPSYYGYGLVNAEEAVHGPSWLIWGNFDVNIPAGESGTFSNMLVGAGGIQLDGSGSLTLAAGGSYGDIVQNGGTLTIDGPINTQLTGTVQINGGTFDVVGNTPHVYQLTATQIAIAQSATMQAVGSIDANITNAGTLDARAQQATAVTGLSIAGNYTATSTANTIIQTGTPISVTGQATLAGSALTVYVPTGYTPSSSELLLSAGSISGGFGPVTVDGGIYYSSGALSYTPTQVDVTLQAASVTAVAKSSLPDVATTQQTAVHLQTALSQVSNWATTNPAAHESFISAAGEFFSVYSAPQAALSIDSLSGQLLASSQGLTFEQAGIVNRTVADRLVDVGSGAAPQGAWFQGIGASGDIARSGYATGSYSGGGSVAGFDTKLNDNFTLGVGLDWNHLGSSYSMQGGNSSSRSTGAMLYAKYSDGNAYVSGRLGQDWIHSDTSRWGLLGITPAAITSSRDDTMTSAYLEGGFDVKSNAWTTTPFVSAGDERLDRAAIAEQGAGGFGIAAPSDDFNQSYAQLGARLAYNWTWSTGQISLKGFALFQRVLGGQNLGFTAAYAGAPTATFQLEGVNSPRNSGWVGVGVNAALNSHWSWFANLDGQVTGGDTKATVFSAGAQYRF